MISAPFVEEAFKGIALVGLLVFFRREFDGLVDGVVYATFVALGFAAFENVVYYARGTLSGGGGGLIGTFFIRGILSPWCHPVFTSMTGLGVGLARETNKTWVKVVAPVFGYFCAVGLHMTWNGVPTIFGGTKNGGAVFIAMYLLFWLPFLLIFFVVVIFLVRREGKIIRKYLEDEVLIGNMSRDEVELVCSPFGRMKALMGAGGFKGRAFVDAASRLALSKWHATVAMEGRKMTISADFIVPLRQELAKIRYEIQNRR
ncbi:MAG: PrsW family intramembrane metalloprotease [Polyangiaceae bacterium]